MAKIQETDLILNEDGSVYHLNLLPENISDTIITVGDPNRVFHVSKYFDEVTFEMNKREFITHTGLLRGKRITVVSSGIGTDNVEILLTELDALANIDLKTRLPNSKRKTLKIVRIGTSGALQEDIPLDSFLVSETAIGFDNLMSFYSLPQSEMELKIAASVKNDVGLPFLPYMVTGSEVLKKQIAFDMRAGNTVTCPGFYAPQGRSTRIAARFPDLLDKLMEFHLSNDDFWLTNFEMETAGYYALGRLLGHEILSVNAIIANRIKNKFSSDPGRTVDDLIKKVIARI
jgi:uridine phosphorylase